MALRIIHYPCTAFWTYGSKCRFWVSSSPIFSYGPWFHFWHFRLEVPSSVMPALRFSPDCEQWTSAFLREGELVEQIWHIYMLEHSAWQSIHQDGPPSLFRHREVSYLLANLDVKSDRWLPLACEMWANVISIKVGAFNCQWPTFHSFLLFSESLKHYVQMEA